MRVLKTFNNMHMARRMNYISKGFFDCLEILTGITVEQIKGSLQYGEESIEKNVGKVEQVLGQNNEGIGT